MAKRWTQQEDEFMIANYESKGLHFCIDGLGRSKSAVLNRAVHLDLHRYGGNRPPKILIKGGYI